MPVGTRVRGNNAFGTTTDNPLAIGATTINSAGLALLPQVTAGNHAVITLDPLRINGAPEIVVVTAHGAGATSATIVRGQYGTSARAHPVGTTWVHAPLTEDVISIVTSATRPTDPYGLQLIGETDTDSLVVRNAANTAWVTAMQLGAWTSWTPTFTNFTLGSGTVSAKYTRIGRTIHYRLHIELSSSTMGTLPTFTLPVPPSADYPANFPMHSMFRILDAGTTVFEGTTEYASGSTVTMLVNTADGTYVARNVIASTAPMTWVNGDRIFIHGTYEAAS